MKTRDIISHPSSTRASSHALVARSITTLSRKAVALFTTSYSHIQLSYLPYSHSVPASLTACKGEHSMDGFVKTYFSQNL